MINSTIALTDLSDAVSTAINEAPDGRFYIETGDGWDCLFYKAVDTLQEAWQEYDEQIAAYWRTFA